MNIEELKKINTPAAARIVAAIEDWQPEAPTTPTPTTVFEQLRGIIKQNPGITGADIRRVVLEQNPDLSLGAVPATLTQLYKAGAVARKPAMVDGSGRKTYAYTVVEGWADDRRRRAGARKKSEVKRAPKKDIFTKAVTQAAVTGVILGITVRGVTHNFSLQEAASLYEQLHQVFAR